MNGIQKKKIIRIYQTLKESWILNLCFVTYILTDVTVNSSGQRSLDRDVVGMYVTKYNLHRVRPKHFGKFLLQFTIIYQKIYIIKGFHKTISGREKVTFLSVFCEFISIPPQIGEMTAVTRQHCQDPTLLNGW